MRRSEVFAWLQAHGGQRDGGLKIDLEEVKNPAYNASPSGQKQPQTLQQKVITWTANDGLTLTVVEAPNTVVGQPNPGEPIEGVPGPVTQVPDPEYDYRGEGRAPRDTNQPVQTPYQAGLSAQQEKEAKDNLEAGRGYHTNDELAVQAQRDAAEQRAQEASQRAADERTRQVAADERAVKQQEIANGLASGRLTIEQAAEARQALASGASTEIARGQLTIAQQAEARQAAAANKPQFLSTADPGNKNIAYFDPTTGQIASTANPNYDAVKVEAEQLQKDLALGIQLNQYTASEAKTKYDQWFQQNVTVPFMAAQEERARAADQRAAMQAEEQRNQFGAQFGLQSAEFGETAGQHAAQNEISLLPYRVGPTFGAEMSSAINSLAAGGKVNGPSASAGINFSPGAFTFKRPDFEGIAAKATAKALSHLTPYKPTAGSFPSVSGGAPSINFGSAPTAGGGVDLTPLINQFTSKYAPQAPAAAPAPPVEPSPPDDQPAE